MALTTIDSIIAGVQVPQFFAKTLSGTLVAGRPHSYWSFAGIPGPGSFDTTLAGVALTSTSTLVNGQIPFYSPGGGNEIRLARFVANANQAGTVMLCDRLWHNGAIDETNTGSQTINSATFPARDNNGSTDGEGVLIGVEVSTATGAGTPTLTMTYTNSANAGSKTATNLQATVASSIAGTFYPLGLAAGDKGVRSIQSFQLSVTWTTGQINLVAYRVLAVLELSAGNIGSALDCLTGGFAKLHDGTVPFLIFQPGSTTSTRIYGQVVYAEG